MLTACDSKKITVAVCKDKTFESYKQPRDELAALEVEKTSKEKDGDTIVVTNKRGMRRK